MDMEVVAQAFATRLFAATADILQRMYPLEPDQIDAYRDRMRRVSVDLGRWLADLTSQDVSEIVQDGRLSFDRWMLDSEDYDATAVCAVANRLIHALSVEQPDLSLHDFVQLVQSTGAYLADMSDHKLSYLAERTANLVVADLGGGA